MRGVGRTGSFRKVVVVGFGLQPLWVRLDVPIMVLEFGHLLHRRAIIRPRA